jgi:hypothetical protein
MLIGALQHPSNVCNHLRGVNRAAIVYRCGFGSRAGAAVM